MAQTITLREITPENEAAVRALRVAPGQEQFVDSVAASLDEAERSADAPNYPLCIMSMMELSPATYIAFGRLTVAFGRLEGHVNWIMSLLLIHHEGKGHTPNAWRVGQRGSKPESWDADLSTKLEKVKELAHLCLPIDLETAVVDLAGKTKAISKQRRRLVHAYVFWDAPPPEAVLSILRTGLEGGFAQEEVSLHDVEELASEVEAAAQTSLDLMISVGEFTRGGT